jgi:transcriptional regulator with XRE-family HTH domain
MRVNGAAIRAIRERSGLSGTALAEQAGIRQSHLSNIEAGRRQPSEELAVSIARVLRSPLVAILADPEKAAS